MDECCDDEHEIDTLKTPVRAFLSFERAEGYERVEKHLMKYQQLNGKLNPLYEELELFGEVA